METLFEQFYDEVLSKELKIPKKQKKRIKEAVLVNSARQAILSSSYRIFPKGIIKYLTEYTAVNTDDLLKRLHEGDAFAGIKETTEAEYRKAIETIGAKFEAYSAATSDYFKRRAKLFSLLVGILLAFTANIDGMRILDALMTNPQMRASFISQQESLENAFQETQARLEKLQLDMGSETSGKQQVEELKSNLDEVSSQLGSLESLGIPIGWNYFPVKSGKAIHQGWRCILDYAVWLLSVFITGLLIGLGAPFWFEVAQRLSEVRQAFKGKRALNQQGQTSSGGESPAQNSKTTIDRIIDSKQ